METMIIKNHSPLLAMALDLLDSSPLADVRSGQLRPLPTSPFPRKAVFVSLPFSTKVDIF